MKFNNIFGKSDASEPKRNNVPWILLTNVSQLDEITALSNEMPVIIFKHSTRCAISRMVLKQFENEFTSDTKVTPYFLDLLSFREISDAIAKRFDVLHQSPQLLLIDGGLCTFNASHDAIDVQNLEARLKLR